MEYKPKKSMPKDRRAAGNRVKLIVQAANLVAAGAVPLVVVIPPQHGDYIAVTTPAGLGDAEVSRWREVLEGLPWDVRVETAHSGSQGTTFRVHPVKQ